MLKIQFKDRRKPAMWLVDSVLKIGSESSCEIVINESDVASVHAELVISQEQILLKNVSENRSVFINDVPIIGQQSLSAWDVIKLGESELEIIDPLSERNPPPAKSLEGATVIRQVVSPWMLKAQTIPLDGQYFSLSDGMIIGREDDSEIKLPLSYVSRKHARISLKNDRVLIDDLESSNGTYVNGERINSRQLFNGDELRLDEFIFHVIGPEGDTKKKTGESNSKEKNKKQLNDVGNTSEKPSVDVDSLIKQGAFLHGLSDDVKGQVFTIKQEESHLSNMLGHHLLRSEKSVSARHVYLNATKNGWQIKNNGASDGLLINDRMQSSRVLNEGDKILIGGTLLAFHSQAKLSDINKAGLAIGNKKSMKGILLIIILVFMIVAGAFYFLK